MTLVVSLLQSVEAVRGLDLVHLRFSTGLATVKRVSLSFLDPLVLVRLTASVLFDLACRISRYSCLKSGSVSRSVLRSELSFGLVRESVAESVVNRDFIS